MPNLINKFLKLDLESPIKVAVIGDSMIDEYFGIKVKRISPEFPIPTYLSEDDECLSFPGGAANTAYAFKHFNAKVNLISFIDSEAKEILNSEGIDTSLCVEIPTKIPRKRRFYADDFPTYRWDVERPKYGLKLEELKGYSDELYKNVLDNEFDLIIYSDYDKGVFDNWRGICQKHQYNNKVCTIVDPKNSYEKWAGCTILKPNKSEALNLSGHSTIVNAAHKLTEVAQYVVITDGNKGITIGEWDLSFRTYRVGEEINTPPRSVIGAGDAVTAFLGMAYTRGFDIKESAEIAWNAGTKYVQNIYNKPLFPIDLVQDKIITNPEVLKNRDFKLVFTNGCFDILHNGHIECLNFAKSKGDKLVVALNSDASVAKLKSGRPYVSLSDRMKVIAGLDMVDYVVSFNEETPIELIKKVSPNVLVKGGDYRLEDILGANLVGEVYTSPLIEGVSTTNLIERIRN